MSKLGLGDTDPLPIHSTVDSIFSAGLPSKAFTPRNIVPLIRRTFLMTFFNNSSRILLGALGAAAMTAGSASAAVVVFDFGNANTVNNSQDGGNGNWIPFATETTAITTSASTTISGVQMTLIRAEITGDDLVANDYWGINNQGIGVITNGAGGTGGRRVNVGETIVFSFDTDVYLTSLRLGSFDALETVTVTPAGGSTITLNGAAAPTDDLLLGNVLVTAGTEIKLTTTVAVSSGVLFNEITVDTEAPLPEPGSLALLGLGGLCVLRRRRA